MQAARKEKVSVLWEGLWSREPLNGLVHCSRKIVDARLGNTTDVDAARGEEVNVEFFCHVCALGLCGDDERKGKNSMSVWTSLRLPQLLVSTTTTTSRRLLCHYYYYYYHNTMKTGNPPNSLVRPVYEKSPRWFTIWSQLRDESKSVSAFLRSLRMLSTRWPIILSCARLARWSEVKCKSVCVR